MFLSYDKVRISREYHFLKIEKNGYFASIYYLECTGVSGNIADIFCN